jgi:hypothetical protein
MSDMSPTGVVRRKRRKPRDMVQTITSRYFGTLSVSRHIVHVSRSSTALSTFVEVAISVLSWYFRVNRNAIIKSEKLCSSCEQNGKSNKAISWCIVCEEAYCEACENWHKSFKLLSQHSMMFYCFTGFLYPIYCLIYSDHVFTCPMVDSSTHGTARLRVIITVYFYC